VDTSDPRLVLHIIRILLQQGLEAGMVAEGRERQRTGVRPAVIGHAGFPTLVSQPTCLCSPPFSRPVKPWAAFRRPKSEAPC